MEIKDNRNAIKGEIKLDNNKRKILLELCNIYFPEFNFEFESIESHLIIFDKKDENIIYQIHWFEFISRYLKMKLDELYFEKVLNPVDPFHVNNRNVKSYVYPKNWRELWQRRPFLGLNDSLNGCNPKEHPIQYLYKIHNSLTEIK